MSLELRVLQHASAILYAVAIFTTLYRLYLRLRTRQWHWDDSLALLSVCFMSFFVSGLFLLRGVNSHIETYEAVTAHYFLVLGYNNSIWLARLSILSTIIRFAPGWRKRRILLAVAGSFVFQFAFLIVQAVWATEVSSPEWKFMPGNQPEAISITQVLTTLISDTSLIALPIWILNTAKLDSGLRVRLLAAFSMSVATTFAAMTHVVVSSTIGGTPALLCGVLEIFVALSVCNAFIIILVMAVGASGAETSASSEATVLSTVITL